MLRVLVLALMLTSPAVAAVDCRIKYLAPDPYASGPVPAHELVGLPLAEVQARYRALAGMPTPPAGASYCKRGPLGFVDSRGSVPVIYFPVDVTERCRREVIEHETAHVRGWPANHPGATVQVGPCSATVR